MEKKISRDKAYWRLALSMATSLLSSSISLALFSSLTLSCAMYSTAVKNDHALAYGFYEIISHSINPQIQPLPLLNISHLLVLSPFSTGKVSLRSSNRSFISLRRFLSASL